MPKPDNVAMLREVRSLRKGSNAISLREACDTIATKYGVKGDALRKFERTYRNTPDIDLKSHGSSALTLAHEMLLVGLLISFATAMMPLSITTAVAVLGSLISISSLKSGRKILVKMVEKHKDKLCVRTGKVLNFSRRKGSSLDKINDWIDWVE